MTDVPPIPPIPEAVTVALAGMGIEREPGEVPRADRGHRAFDVHEAAAGRSLEDLEKERDQAILSVLAQRAKPAL